MNRRRSRSSEWPERGRPRVGRTGDRGSGAQSRMPPRRSVMANGAGQAAPATSEATTIQISRVAFASAHDSCRAAPAHAEDAAHRYMKASAKSGA